MILITGSTGFIGTHLLESLVNLYGKENVLAFSSKPVSQCEYILHDQYTFDNNIFLQKGYENIDTVIHAGAFIPKSSQDANNVSECNSNITSTAKLLEAELPNLKKFIFISTVDVYSYGNPITEETNVSPASLYGQSKLYCEAMVSAWAVQNDITHQILRIGHVFGEGEEVYKKLIPVTLKNLKAGNSPSLFGEGKEVRSFIYISDVVDAILSSVKLEEYIGVVNIVSEEKVSIKELMDKMIQISNVSVEVKKVQSAGNSRDLIFDGSKMKNNLINPKVGLTEGLRREWNYIKELD